MSTVERGSLRHGQHSFPIGAVYVRPVLGSDSSDDGNGTKPHLYILAVSVRKVGGGSLIGTNAKKKQ